MDSPTATNTNPSKLTPMAALKKAKRKAKRELEKLQTKIARLDKRIAKHDKKIEKAARKRLEKTRKVRGCKAFYKSGKKPTTISCWAEEARPPAAE
jgi:predicted  nucleic acid-binding Zn-ribbon protein